QAPVDVRALSPAPALLNGLPEDWQPLLAGPLALTLAGESPGRVVLEQGKLSATLPREIRLTSGERRLSASLDGNLALAEDGALEKLELDRIDLTAQDLPTPYGRLASLSLSGTLEGVPRAAAGRADVALEFADLAIEGA